MSITILTSNPSHDFVISMLAVAFWKKSLLDRREFEQAGKRGAEQIEGNADERAAFDHKEGTSQPAPRQACA